MDIACDNRSARSICKHCLPCSSNKSSHYFRTFHMDRRTFHTKQSLDFQIIRRHTFKCMCFRPRRGKQSRLRDTMCIIFRSFVNTFCIWGHKVCIGIVLGKCRADMSHSTFHHTKCGNFSHCCTRDKHQANLAYIWDTGKNIQTQMKDRFGLCRLSRDLSRQGRW